MSVRRDTNNRLTLFRVCGTCGKSFTTTAASPWMRQIARDGKRQATTYFCSSACFQASYKHKFDGKAAERRKEREAKRDVTEKNRRYYQSHAEQERARLENQYQRRKRKMLEAAV